jgi:hypothetical protein
LSAAAPFPFEDPEAAKAWWRAQPAIIPVLIGEARQDVRGALRRGDMATAMMHVRKIVGLRHAGRIMAGERIRCQFSVAELVETNRVKL